MPGTAAALFVCALLVNSNALAEQLGRRIWFEPSMMMPSDNGFDEFYGNSFAGHIRFEFRAGNRLWTGFRLGYIVNRSRFTKDLRFRDCSLGYFGRFDLKPSWDHTSILAGGGVGMDYRKVSYTPSRANYYAQANKGTLAQSNYDLSIMVEIAVTQELSRGLLVAIQTEYNYFPFGDPERGDFGNTGGLSIGGSLGIAF